MVGDEFDEIICHTTQMNNDIEKWMYHQMAQTPRPKIEDIDAYAEMFAYRLKTTIPTLYYEAKVKQEKRRMNVQVLLSGLMYFSDSSCWEK